MAGNKNIYNNVTLIVIAVLLLILGIGSGMYFFSENTKVSNELNAKQSELTTIQTKLQSLPDLETEFQRLSGEIERLATYIPSKEGQAQFVKELQMLADKNQVILKSCTVSPDPLTITNLPKYSIYKWDVKLKCDYPNLLSLIKDITNASRFVLVSNVSVEGNEEVPSELLVGLSLDLISKNNL